MTPDDENRAAEARRLEDNETWQLALAALRSAALEALAEADPSDQGAIMAAQADIRAIGNLRSAITSMVFAGAAQRHRLVA